MTTSNLDRRARRYDALADRLAAMSDDEVLRLLSIDASAWRGSVHGSRSGTVAIDGVSVFVKQLALTAVEQAAPRSTANHFDLPGFYQYGVGSAGFGVWRELEAHLRASAWVLADACPHLPLAYHWRVLPRTAPELSPAHQAWLARAPAYWDDSDAVRARLMAIAEATLSVVLFIEHVPETLDAWLKRRIAAGADASLEAEIVAIHGQLMSAASFMNRSGMLHFDLNASNVLTDGKQAIVADFGLAICEDFDLSSAERAFFAGHLHYDMAYLSWAFAEWLKVAKMPVETPALRAQLGRSMPVADRFGIFLHKLGRGPKTEPFPAAELEAALAAAEDAPT